MQVNIPYMDPLGYGISTKLRLSHIQNFSNPALGPWGKVDQLGGRAPITPWGQCMVLWAYLGLAGHSLSSFKFRGILYVTH